MGTPARKSTPGKSKGSILFVSLILLTIAAFGVMAVVKFINDSHRTALRDRDYVSAFYAAESGVERVVDYFNSPGNFSDDTPSNYTDTGMNRHPAVYQDVMNIAPVSYDVFEPYWTKVAKDSDDNPIFDDDGNPIITGDTYFANLFAGTAYDVSLTSKIPSFVMNMENIENVEFKGTTDRITAWVSRIEIQNPADMTDLAAITADGKPVICKIIATGRTQSGVNVSVESIITELRSRTFDSPAAILSKDVVDYNGQFNVFWGELWSQSNIDLPSNWTNHVPKYDTRFNEGPGGGGAMDQWFGIRTDRWIVDRSGKYANGFTTASGGGGRGRGGGGGGGGGAPQFTSNTPNRNSSTYYKPFDVSGQIDDYRNFYQNQQLEWPVYDYDEWKEFVQEFDFPYFYADTDGELWGENEDGELVKKSYAEWFDHNDPSAPDYWSLENIIVFIDGVPQNDSGQTSSVINGEFYPRNPEDPGVVDVTIRLSGGGLHTRGVMLVSPNMVMKGQGNTGVTGADIPESAGGGFLMPDGNNYNNAGGVDIFHHGLLWGYREMDIGGNRTIYGSIHATNGYGQGGSPSVWYNARMRDGGWITLNRSRVARDLWNISRDVVPEEDQAGNPNEQNDSTGG